MLNEDFLNKSRSDLTGGLVPHFGFDIVIYGWAQTLDSGLSIPNFKFMLWLAFDEICIFQL